MHVVQQVFLCRGVEREGEMTLDWEMYASPCVDQSRAGVDQHLQCRVCPGTLWRYVHACTEVCDEGAGIGFLAVVPTRVPTLLTSTANLYRVQGERPGP